MQNAQIIEIESTTDIRSSEQRSVVSDLAQLTQLIDLDFEELSMIGGGSAVGCGI